MNFQCSSSNNIFFYFLTLQRMCHDGTLVMVTTTGCVDIIHKWHENGGYNSTSEFVSLFQHLNTLFKNSPLSKHSLSVVY